MLPKPDIDQFLIFIPNKIKLYHYTINTVRASGKKFKKKLKVEEKKTLQKTREREFYF